MRIKREVKEVRAPIATFYLNLLPPYPNPPQHCNDLLVAQHIAQRTYALRTKVVAGEAVRI